jgi:hypothetical protein
MPKHPEARLASAVCARCESKGGQGMTECLTLTGLGARPDGLADDLLQRLA